MNITFTGITGENRKGLVKAIAEATGMKSDYLGTPSYAYRVGVYTIGRDGGVEIDEFADPKEIDQLLIALRARDFVPTEDWTMLEEPPAESDVRAGMSRPGVDGIILSFPKNGMDAQAVENLRRLVSGKGWLLRMALEAQSLDVEEDGDALHFPWLAGTAPSELVEACMLLIAAMIKLARKQRRVTLTETETDNPRYALRCFLLRLGFIGDEYKTPRKLLMRGIPGNGAKRRVSDEDVPVASGE